MTKAWKYFVFITGGIALAITLLMRAVPMPAQAGGTDQGPVLVQGGTVEFNFNTGLLEALGFRFHAQGQLYEATDDSTATFAIAQSSTWEVSANNGGGVVVDGGILRTAGALILERPGSRIVIGNLEIHPSPKDVLTMKNTLTPQGLPEDIFELQSVMIESRLDARELTLIGELVIAEQWGAVLDFPAAAGAIVGSIVVEAQTIPSIDVAADVGSLLVDADMSASRQPTGTEDGYPDVIVADLQSIRRYYDPDVPTITAFAVGTHACNYGTARANWFPLTNQHPLIIQNAYRLKDNRFEQIGFSWLKHGFYAVDDDLCGLGCEDVSDINPPGTQLGIGCSDPYSSTLNGQQNNLSPRSTVNAFSGFFPFPWPGWEDDPPVLSPIERRLQVYNADLDPAFNPGARYFVQGHYITPGDSLAGTQDNNASYREVLAEKNEFGEYSLVVDYQFNTQREQPAVRAWQDCDPTVVETDIRVPGEGLFILAAKAYESGHGTWLYSYALQNLNSDRSGQSFTVRIPPGGLVTNLGFHDIDYHSGDAIDPTDWGYVVDDESITWSTDTYDVNPDANALRFGTVYNFYFESNIEPAPSTITIGIFKPGVHNEVHGSTIGPKLLMVDCNDNDIADECDVDCSAPGCEAPCETSSDCNSNQIPDECEPDCNNNGLADECDIADCLEGEVWCDDCNNNSILDDCETDCNDNGLPDNCEILPDTDGDNVADCYDLCLSTPVAYACACPELIECCFGGGPCTPMYYQTCLDLGGIPSCFKVPCRQGCMIGDLDADDDLDLVDFHTLQTCISEDAADPGYVPPSQECSIGFDYDSDDDVDLLDVEAFQEFFEGP
ncbi:MAG: hypothetical protein JSU63_07880 [Phycisphaerales bacterium]|nr:MAG: hypothetical protein JSU63_07880 [Phycisphaerales bacterium]